MFIRHCTGQSQPTRTVHLIFNAEFFGQSARTVLEHENPLGFIRTETLHLNYTQMFNMQATFTYKPLKPTASVCKDRKC